MTRNRSGARLRVAWIAPVDLRPFLDRFDVRLQGAFHNAPWIANGALALAESGVDLHIVTYDRRVNRDYEFTDGGVTYHVLRVSYPTVPRALVGYRLDRRRFFECLRRIEPDLVHGHGTENIYSYVAVDAGMPHVVSMQAVIALLARTHRQLTRTAIEHQVVKFIERATVSRASHVIVEAPFVGDFVRTLSPGAAIQVVGNIVTEDFFRVVRRSEVMHRLVFVGRLVQTKGVEETIRAFHAVAERFPDAALELVGEGLPAYVEGPLSDLIRRGPGAPRITRRGHLPAREIARLHETAAALLLPTYYDTSPNAVSEAMVAGVPVIASAVGGLPYMLQGGQAGELIPARDVEALANAIERCFLDPSGVRSRAMRGQTLARERYHRRTFVTGLRRMYDAALG